MQRLLTIFFRSSDPHSPRPAGAQPGIRIRMTCDVLGQLPEPSAWGHWSISKDACCNEGLLRKFRPFSKNWLAAPDTLLPARVTMVIFPC